MSAVDFSAFLIYFRFNYNFFYYTNNAWNLQVWIRAQFTNTHFLRWKIHLVQIQLIVMW